MTLMYPENAIEIIRGSSKTLALSVSDETGVPVDLTGAKIYFSIKATLDDPRPLVQKSSDAPTQVEITTPREGKAKIYLQPSDTQNLDPIEYTFDVWAVLANSKRYPVVLPSIFRVKPGVTLIPL